MTILKDIKVHLTFDDLKTQGLPVKDPGKIEKDIHQALELSRSLLVPQLAYEWVAVRELQKSMILCHTGRSKKTYELKIDGAEALLDGAQDLLVSIATIGSQIDQQIESLNQSGQYLLSYLLDHLGLMALNQITSFVCCLAEKEARKNNWGVGPFLSPGAFDGWDMEGQAVLFDFVPGEQIDVHLNAQGMMLPLKSVTGIIAVGPGFEAVKVGSLCRYCGRSANCKNRIDFD